MVISCIFLTILYIAVAGDAAWLARAIRVMSLRRYQRWYIYLLLYVSVAILISIPDMLVGQSLATLLTGLKTYKIPARGMEPALQIGDHVMVDIRVYRHRPPQVGEVIVFVHPSDPAIRMIKRVAEAPKGTAGDALFVLGDDLENSSDSRQWGPVPLTAVRGKALYIYWSLDRTRIGQTIQERAEPRSMTR